MLRDRCIRLGGSILKLAFRQTRPSGDDCPRSIAILKPCCLGDVLMSTAILEPLRRNYPLARLDFFVGDWSRGVVANNQSVSQVLGSGRVGAGGKYSIGEYLSLVSALRKGQFDWCIVLERSVWIALLPFLAGIRVRAGLDSEGRGFPLNVRVQCDGARHEAEMYLDCVRALGVPVESPRLEFHPTTEDRERARSMLPAPERAAPVVAIHPGGGANPGMTLPAKRWLPERFAAVANILVQRRGATIVLLGAVEDAKLAEQVRESMRVPAIDLTGKTSLGEMAALLELSQLFIGNDTGPMHLAVAVGTPVVAIFGPSDPRVYGPFSKRSAVVTAALHCSPCFVRGKARDCTNIRCMQEVSVEQVWNAVDRQLNTEPEGD